MSAESPNSHARHHHLLWFAPRSRRNAASPLERRPKLYIIKNYRKLKKTLAEGVWRGFGGSGFHVVPGSRLFNAWPVAPQIRHYQRRPQALNPATGKIEPSPHDFEEGT